MNNDKGLSNLPAITENYQAGDWIFHEGDSGDCAYLVEQGEVLIALQRDDELIQLGLYGEGALFGEMAILSDRPRSAGALAYSDCSLKRISRDQLNRRLEQADPIIKVCMSVLMGHLRKSLEQYSQDRQPEEPQSLDEQLRQAADQAVLGSNHKNPAPEQKTPQLTRSTPINDEILKVALQSLNLENELNYAILNNQLCLFYQPIIEARSGRLAGFEALMRWIHPERGFVSPAEFIPIAERSGLIIQMTKWALKTACDELVSLRDQLLSNMTFASHVSERLFMSINFSSRDFLDNDLMEYVNQLLQASQLPEKSIKIEITESVLMSSPDQVQSALDVCRSHGASIAIDDFGTGYSSLSYLQDLPADTLKIDQAFIRPMHNDERHLALVESIIHLAQRLDMVTVAEGVETQRDFDALAMLQCDFLQGYYFGRPMPAAEVLKWAQAKWETDDYTFLG